MSLMSNDPRRRTINFLLHWYFNLKMCFKNCKAIVRYMFDYTIFFFYFASHGIKSIVPFLEDVIRVRAVGWRATSLRQSKNIEAVMRNTTKGAAGADAKRRPGESRRTITISPGGRGREEKKVHSLTRGKRASTSLSVSLANRTLFVRRDETKEKQ